MGLLQTVRNLPMEVAGDVDVKAFPRLQKSVPAGSKVSVAKLLLLSERAGSVFVPLPAILQGSAF